MDSELREALNDYDTCNDYDILVCCDLTVIVDAARKVANPDYEGTLIRSAWNGDRRLWTLRMIGDVDAGDNDQFILIRILGGS